MVVPAQVANRNQGRGVDVQSCSHYKLATLSNVGLWRCQPTQGGSPVRQECSIHISPHTRETEMCSTSASRFWSERRTLLQTNLNSAW